MSSRKSATSLEKILTIDQQWTCFEGLYLNKAHQPKRRALFIRAPSYQALTLNTFEWQKILQGTHERVFISTQAWIDYLASFLPDSWQLQALSDREIGCSTFEQEDLDWSVITTVRFICPESSQPYYGHLRWAHFTDKNLLQWALLQVRSEELAPYQLASRLRDIVNDEQLQLHWALSRRGGISFQGSTTPLTGYLRSAIE